MSVYYAVVHQEKGSAFGISFPDVPGCFGASDDEAGVIDAAQEALSLFAADDDALPKARSIADIRRDADVRADLLSGSAYLIAVTVIESARKQRYNIMLEPQISTAAEDAARKSGSSKSDYISMAIIDRLKRDGGLVRVSRAKRTAKRKRRAAVKVAKRAHG